MNLFGRNRKQVAALALALVATSTVTGAALVGCSDDTEYAYFSVRISLSAAIDDDTRLTIASCALTVEGDDQDYTALPCTLNRVPYELGTAEFSTNKKRGQLKFVAVMRNLNNEPVARGESDFVAIVPNKTTATTITAGPLSPSPGDAMTDALVAPDGGSSDASTGDALSDASTL